MIYQNTFLYKDLKNDKTYTGEIVGIKCVKGYFNQYLLKLNVTETNYIIWYDDWMTETQIKQEENIIGYCIDKEALLEDTN